MLLSPLYQQQFCVHHHNSEPQPSSESESNARAQPRGGTGTRSTHILVCAEDRPVVQRALRAAHPRRVQDTARRQQDRAHGVHTIGEIANARAKRFKGIFDTIDVVTDLLQPRRMISVTYGHSHSHNHCGQPRRRTHM
jgi:hypothetical protein